MRVATARQRHRQFHESGAAYSRQDRAGRSGGCDDAASRTFGSSHRPHQTITKSMAASTITIRPSALEIARATAAAIPSEVSTRPLLGILGVVTGAGLVTLAGRMLSLGLADLKGHVGIGFDNGAWLDSAYNASLMFIGPFSVYLGGLLGPRRLLLFAAGVFTLTSICLPFIHSYTLLIAALIVAGLTSGTFYPLTLTFALRNTLVRCLP